MAYTKIGWVNDRTPAINQNNLNHMDQGIYDAHQELSEYEDIFTGDVAESVQNWLDEHPEATTTVLDGSITKKKFSRNVINSIDSLVSLSRTKYKVLPNDEFQGSLYESDRKALQSADYNSNTGNYILLYSDADNTGDCLFVELNNDFTFLRRKSISPDDVGHGNDLTYCPDTDKYVIATQRTGELAVVDANTLELDNSITLDGVGLVVQVSYDSDKQIYYVADSLYLFKVSSDFSTVERIAAINAEAFLIPYDGVTTIYTQGSCVLDGRFVLSCWLGGSSLSYGRLIAFSEDGTTALNCYDFLCHVLSDELETVVNKDGQLFVFSYQGEKIYVDYFSTTGSNADYLYPLNVKRYSYTNGSSIFEDIYTQSSEQSFYQAYISFSSAHPVLGGANGMLSGFKSIDGYGWQEFSSHTVFARRVCNGGTWSSWKYIMLSGTNIPGEPVILNILSSITTAYSQIIASDARVMSIYGNGTAMLIFKFKCSSAITSGSVTLPESVLPSRTETQTALASLDGNTGFAQLDNRTLLIRCGASPSNYICGQLVYVPKSDS